MTDKPSMDLNKIETKEVKIPISSQLIDSYQQTISFQYIDS